MDDFGLTFSPSGAMNKDRASANADGNGPVQEAIRTLALRLPTVQGAQSISPLVGGQGAQGFGAPGMGLEQLLARIFGQMGNQPGQSGQMPGLSMPGFARGGGMPSPNIIPGGIVKDGATPIPGTPATLDPEPAPTPLPQPPAPASNLRTRMQDKYDTPRFPETFPG